MSSRPSTSLTRTGNLGWAFGFATVIGALLMSALVYFGGVWNFIANTRILDLMIKGGLVKYEDTDAGFIDGVLDLKYYLQSQDPVRWDLAFIVLLLFLLFFAIKAVQLHGLNRLFGIRTDWAKSLRTFSFGLFVEKLFPFQLGDVALAKNLQDEGAPLDRAKAVTFSAQAFLAFEVVIFALIGLPFMGWGPWLGQMVWALAIFAIAYAFLRRIRPRADPGGDSVWQHLHKLWRILVQRPKEAIWLAFLSLVAFGLEDIAAYFVAMSFTANNVILKVNFAVLLMAVVASYIARFLRVTPGGLGQFEWGFAAGLYLGGVGFPEAVTIAFLDNAFRYVSAAVFYFFTTRHATVTTSIRSVLTTFSRGGEEPEPADAASVVVEEGAPTEIPRIPLPRVLPAARLWMRGLITAGTVLALFYLDQISLLLTDYWLMKSVGYLSVFWTNFLCGAGMFAFGLLTMGFGIAYPAFGNRLSRSQKGFVVGLAVFAGSIGGYFLSLTYLNILLSFGMAFGARDPVFGIDAAIYVCTLPSIWVFWDALMWGTGLGLLSAIGCAYMAYRNRGEHEAPARGLGRLQRVAGAVATRGTLVALALAGVVLAVGEFLTRYSLLLKDNTDNGFYRGASYIDVVGFFSNLNYVTVTVLAILSVTTGLIFVLRACRESFHGVERAVWRERLVLGGRIMLLAVLIDFGFQVAVVIRDAVAVTPNNPVINLPWIAQHIKWSRQGYDLNKFEEVQFIPKGVGDPVPDVDKLLASPVIKNAPLWPGFTSYLERYIDPQHGQRILQTKGDKTVYGPTIEVFKQQQKLRTYYDFLGIDTVRYRIDGEKEMFVSGVRELPLIDPVPWLGWFGQRYMLFTHGFGLTMAPVAEVGVEGAPNFVSYNIPTEAKHPEIKVKDDRIYYGEGASTMAYSNVNLMKEFDYPTEQDRAELWLPESLDAGVKMDSILKRLVFGYRSGQFLTVVFSKLITDETRVHFWRTPIERLERIAPFLYFDSNPYAVDVDGKIVWLVNALTTSDRYPYSRIRPLGNKSDERARFPRPDRLVNYVEDSVKCTVDATTGKVKFYKISNGPLVRTWAEWIYPDLFTDEKEMPQGVRAQLTYPVQWFHTQIDDAWLYYHMNDPMYYFNMEDMWDDSDEVLGPIIDTGAAIRFSIEPFYVMTEMGKGGLPPAKSGEATQFALAAIYTPEKALNLRGIPIAFQDPGEYGRVVVLGIPKGLYSIGPEQADSAIDQNPRINEQISWWNRRGSDVIRGHTTALLIDGEVIYVEPMFIRSQQLPVTQLKRVSVVFRGVARMGGTLEEALRLAVQGYIEEHGAMAPSAKPATPVMADHAGRPGAAAGARGGS